MPRLVFTLKEASTLPWASVSLFLLFYFIGFYYLDTSKLPLLKMDTWIIQRDALELLSLRPEFHIQWQIFTYHLIHFALVHYAYTGILLLYYVTGLEKTTSPKFVVVCYFSISIIWPLIMGIGFFWLIDIFPQLNEYLITQNQSYFLGPSVGIWGLIGLSVPSNHKRRLFWFGIVILFIPEFLLKLMSENKDITSNVTHLLIFFICWILSSTYIECENNLHQGELKLSDRWDKIIIFGIFLHGLGLILYVLEEINIKS